MAIPVDLVWARAEKWFGDHGLNIENSQRGSGLMTANVENSAEGWSGWIVAPWGPKVTGQPEPADQPDHHPERQQQRGDRQRQGNTQLYFVESSGERVLAPSITPVCVSRGSLEQSLFATLGNRSCPKENPLPATGFLCLSFAVGVALRVRCHRETAPARRT